MTDKDQIEELRNEANYQRCRADNLAGLAETVRTLDESMAASLEAVEIAIDRIHMRIYLLDEQLRIDGARLAALETAVKGATDTSLHAARLAALETAVKGATDTSLHAARLAALETAVKGATDTSLHGARLAALETAVKGATDTSLHAARQADELTKRLDALEVHDGTT